MFACRVRLRLFSCVLHTHARTHTQPRTRTRSPHMHSAMLSLLHCWCYCCNFQISMETDRNNISIARQRKGCGGIFWQCLMCRNVFSIDGDDIGSEHNNHLIYGAYFHISHSRRCARAHVCVCLSFYLTGLKRWHPRKAVSFRLHLHGTQRRKWRTKNQKQKFFVRNDEQSSLRRKKGLSCQFIECKYSSGEMCIRCQ